jgi:cold shock CspA family protein
MQNKTQIESLKQQGLVKKFIEDRGFGFISTNGKLSNQLFFHFSNVKNFKLAPIFSGETISFDIGTHKDKPSAYNIQRIWLEEAIDYLKGFQKDDNSNIDFNNLSQNKLTLQLLIEGVITEQAHSLIVFLLKLPNFYIEHLYYNSKTIVEYVESYLSSEDINKKNINNLWYDFYEKKRFNQSKTAHRLIYGLAGTGKTETLNQFYNSKAVIIKLSHGEKQKRESSYGQIFTNSNSNSKTIFQVLKYEAGFVFNPLSLKSAINEFINTKQSKSDQDDLKQCVDLVNERINRLHQNVLNNQERIELKNALNAIYKGKGITENKSIIDNIFKDKNFDVIVTNHQQYQQYENFKKDDLISSNAQEFSNNYSYSFEDGIKYDIDFFNWLSKRGFYTYHSLKFFFLEDEFNVRIISNKRIMVDDLQNFSSSECEVLMKILDSASSSIVTYDENQLIYSFYSASMNNIDNYIEKFKPEIFHFNRNYRGQGFLIDKINEELINRNKEVCVFTTKTTKKYKSFHCNVFDWLKDMTDYSNLVPQSKHLRNIKTIKAPKICLVFKINKHVDQMCQMLKERHFSYTKIDRNLFETRTGENYIFLFKFLLSKSPSSKFIESIKNQFPNLSYSSSVINSILSCSLFNIYNVLRKYFDDKLIYVIITLMKDTNKSNVRDALTCFLDNIDEFPYYDTHYYNHTDQCDVSIFVSTFHRLKQVREFDFVIFPQVLIDMGIVDNLDSNLHYLSLCKAKTGYGLFDFKMDADNVIYNNEYLKENALLEKFFDKATFYLLEEDE